MVDWLPFLRSIGSKGSRDEAMDDIIISGSNDAEFSSNPNDKRSTEIKLEQLKIASEQVILFNTTHTSCIHLIIV
jgi:hypothetical protein